VLENIFSGKVVILGIGNTLRSDDGLGPHLIRLLENKVEAELLDCGETPENHTARIRGFDPDTIVLVDAVDLHKTPGSIELIEPERIAEFTFSTHNSSLLYFVNFISAETSSKVYVVGVQPQSLELKEGLSGEVSKAIQNLASEFLKILPRRG
jgi:hydrogenase 3 maturation protease